MLQGIVVVVDRPRAVVSVEHTRATSNVVDEIN